MCVSDEEDTLMLKANAIISIEEIKVFFFRLHIYEYVVFAPYRYGNKLEISICLLTD